MIRIRNKKVISLLKNFSFTITSNLLNFVIASIVVLIVPKYIGVEEYGYWQLYVLYSSYVFIFHFGWNDGIYLKHGGDEYNSLNKNHFFSQFYMLLLLQLVFALILFFVSIFIIKDSGKVFVFRMTALCMVIVNLRYMLLFILQATNRIREYALLNITDRLFYLILVFSFLIFGIKDYRYIVISDLLGKFIALLLGIYFCKDIVVRKLSSFRMCIGEVIQYTKIGIRMVIANMANRLVIGSVKFGIESAWGIATFGKISLTLSISNLMMLFISSVGMVMFPVLRRTPYNSLTSLYIVIREILMALLLGALLFYYPFKYYIQMWLPQYSEGLAYMGFLFPIFIYEGRMSLLINAYMKTLRKESLTMKINLFTVFVSMVVTFISTVVFKNLNIAVLSIFAFIALKTIISELILFRIMNIRFNPSMIYELVLSVLFILISAYESNYIKAALMYSVIYLLYLILRRVQIATAIERLRQYMEKS